MPPKFSIIIPAHNEENYIRQTLHSIKQQTFQDFETIVVANGCTDKTEEIVRKRENEKLRLFSLPKPNVSVARNAGALNAQGSILVFLDADTQLAADTLYKINKDFIENYAVATTKVKPDSERWKYNFAMKAKNFLLKTGIFNGFSGILICSKDDFNDAGGYDPEVIVKEQHQLRRKLQEKGKYKCLDSYVTTSMRRFERWSFREVAFFWAKTWSRYYLGKDLKETNYEKIR